MRGVIMRKTDSEGVRIGTYERSARYVDDCGHSPVENHRKKAYNRWNGKDGSVKWVMKNWVKRKRLRWTLKIADILVWGRFTPPLTAHKRTAVDRSPTVKNSRTVRNSSVEYSSVAVLLRAFKGKPKAVLSVAGYLPLARNLRTVRAFGLKV